MDSATYHSVCGGNMRPSGRTVQCNSLSIRTGARIADAWFAARAMARECEWGCGVGLHFTFRAVFGFEVASAIQKNESPGPLPEAFTPTPHET